MSDQNDLAAFLRARRETTQPADLGMPEHAPRRVPGLRRAELAARAGVSVAYLTRLEQGHDRRPSPQVLHSLARALNLDGLAAAHLHGLANVATTPSNGEPPAETVPSQLTRFVLEELRPPAVLLGRCLDVLESNASARALNPSYRPGENVVRSVFLDPASCALYVDLDIVRLEAVGTLRVLAAGGGADPHLERLVSDLGERHAVFAELWARQEVQAKTAGTRRFNHPEVGRFTLHHESLHIGGADRQILVVYHSAQGTEGAVALRQLGDPRASHAERRLP